MQAAQEISARDLSLTVTAPANPPYTALDFIADQLRAANKGGDWDSQGIDRARELGAILLRNGIIDLSKLGAVRLDVVSREHPWAAAETRIEIALTYEGRQIGYLGTPDEPAREPWLQNYVLLAWSSAGHGHISYITRFSPQGFVIVPQWGSSSDWGEFRQVVRFFVTVYLMYLSAGTASGAGGTVGGAVMGAGFAASYPLLTSIIGNIAIGAYFSGGDVKQAVRGALIAQLAGSVGDFAGQVTYTATQIEILARLADAAVTAFARGADAREAVQKTLLLYGFTSVGEFLDSKGASMDIDTSGYPIEGDAYNPPTFDAYGPGSGWAQDVPAFDGGPMTFDSGNTVEPGGFFNLGNTDIPTAFDPGTAPVGFSVGGFTADGVRVEAPQRPAAEYSFANLTNTVTGAALSALKLVQAWNQAKGPAPVTQARAQTTGGVVSGSDAGVVLTRRPDGSVVAARPPVGVPQSTTTGNLIVNNGDGTYTLIEPDGRRRVIAYGQNTGSDGGISWPVLLGGAGLLISILK